MHATACMATDQDHIPITKTPNYGGNAEMIAIEAIEAIAWPEPRHKGYIPPAELGLG
jgi:hypothetical protein